MPFLLMAQKQHSVKINNPDYDQRKLVTYGFSFGFHMASLQLKYSDFFITPKMDSVHSILPFKKPGFSIGVMANLKIAPFFDIRITPKITFSQYKLQYNYILKNPFTVTTESVNIDFPILLKYKSQRRGNIRMYIIGGITPSIQAGAKTELSEDENLFQLKKQDLMVEFGFGFDLYYSFFKFSPEIRYSLGLLNLVGSKNDFTAGIKDLKSNFISIYIHFQ